MFFLAYKGGLRPFLKVGVAVRSHYCYCYRYCYKHFLFSPSSRLGADFIKIPSIVEILFLPPFSRWYRLNKDPLKIYNFLDSKNISDATF
jgi:hypothetical protein